MKKLARHKLHRMAIPTRSRKEAEELLSSVVEEGVLRPCTVYRSGIVDGWMRHKICNHLQIPTPTISIGRELIATGTLLEEWMLVQHVEGEQDRLSVGPKAILAGALVQALHNKRKLKYKEAIAYVGKMYCGVTENMAERGWYLLLVGQPWLVESVRKDQISIEAAKDVMIEWRRIGKDSVTQKDVASEGGYMKPEWKEKMFVQSQMKIVMSDLGRAYRSFKKVEKAIAKRNREETLECQQYYDKLMELLISIKSSNTLE